MTSNRKIVLCLSIILALIVAECGVLYAAGVGSDALVQQLRSDIDLILCVSGAIVAALITTVGILWRTLRASQSEFIATLKKIERRNPHGN